MSMNSSVLVWVYFYRPQTKFAKVMFSQVFVCPQGGIWEGGGEGNSMSRAVSVQGVSVQGGLCLGVSLSRGVSFQGVSVRETPLPDREPPYSKEQVVCILLECILVGSFLVRHPLITHISVEYYIHVMRSLEPDSLDH